MPRQNFSQRAKIMAVCRYAIVLAISFYAILIRIAVNTLRTPMNYLDFDLNLEAAGQGGDVLYVMSPAGEVTASFSNHQGARL
jgi:hypothetical protein